MSTEVLLYSRQHCGLCEEAAVELQALSGDLDFALIEHDIDTNPALREQYDSVIPVIVVGDRVVAQAPFAPEALREIIAEALQRTA